MAEDSKIQWTTHTFNPFRGCSKVSAGCANCYAETLSKRNPGTLGMWGPKGTRVVASETTWKEPIRWNKKAGQAYDEWHTNGMDAGPPPERPRVFCASLADVFEAWAGPMVDSDGAVLHECSECGNWRPIERMCHGPNAHRALTMQDVRNRLFKLIDSTPHLDWLLLTKRPENIARMMPKYVRTTPSENWFFDAEERKRRGLTHAGPHKSTMSVSGVGVIRPNVWLGASVEDQKTAEERIPLLLQVPAAVRFLSMEPLLGPVDLSKYLRCPRVCEYCHASDFSTTTPEGWELVWQSWLCGPCRTRASAEHGDDWLRKVRGGTYATIPDPRPWKGINWVIVGGESGPDARPMRIEWVRSIIDQCKAASVPVFMKQLGEVPSTTLPDGETWPGHSGPSSPVGFSGNGFGDYYVTGLKDKKGGDPAEWPAPLRVREFPTPTNTEKR